MGVILGAAWDCSHDDLRPFFRSLSATSFDGATFLFTSNVSVNFDQCLCIPFEPNLRQLNVVYRFKLYLDFLVANRHILHNEKIMLTDLRDVVFEKDPFGYAYPDGLCVFLEDESKTLATCPFNSAWINATFGPSTLALLADKPISCAGVIVGDYSQMVEYLRLLISLLVRDGSNDQGAHNGIIHMRLMPGINVFRNENGPVLTVGNMKSPRFGTGACVVHQYDRHRDMVNIVTKRFGGK